MMEEPQRGINQNNKLPPAIPELVQTIAPTNKHIVLLFFSEPAALQLLYLMVLENLFEMWHSVALELKVKSQESFKTVKKSLCCKERVTHILTPFDPNNHILQKYSNRVIQG